MVRSQSTHFVGAATTGVFAPNSRLREQVTPSRRGRRKAETVHEPLPSRHTSMTWAQRLKRVFNIDNTTILVGNHSSQTVTNNVSRGDFEGLKTFLMQHDVDAVEIDNLRIAIEADKNSSDIDKRRFGPRVRDWLKAMLGKAVENSWQIEIGIASNLLTEALKAFYGGEKTKTSPCARSLEAQKTPHETGRQSGSMYRWQLYRPIGRMLELARSTDNAWPASD